MPIESALPARRSSGTSRHGASATGGVSKRSSNACSRCRRQKIKCSGTEPCDACKKRKLACEFEARDQKVLVTRGYLLDLEQQAAQQSAPNLVQNASPRADINAEGASSFLTLDNRRSSRSQSASDSSWDRSRSPGRSPSRRESIVGLGSVASLVNPLSAGRSMYMTSKEGREFYLGTSSNWSFSRRVLTLTHEYVHSSPIPAQKLLFDGTAYDLGWDGTRTSPLPEPPLMPSYDHAVHLINTVKFHCGQVFHLYDDETFMPYLDEFYDDPATHIAKADLRYINLLLLLAFGKAFVEMNTAQWKQPPGLPYFITALRLLPNIHVLVLEPFIATEVLCCISLFFQCIDYRHSSHCFIGQAMRVALGQGFHSDMPPEHLGDKVVQRSRKIWWTVYVLDREMTSLMGQPQSIHDDDVRTRLPDSLSPRRVAAMNMHIRICRSIASVGRGIYGANGRLHDKFLLSTKKVLESIAGLADELQRQFPLDMDKTVNGVTRTSGYLHLLYHQCVVLATRPLLLCFLKMRFENPSTVTEGLTNSQTVWKLIKMCIDSSYQMITILDCLQTQGLLETFLPFDLEALTVSSLNLLIVPVLDPGFLEHYHRFREKAYTIFNEFIRKGNLISVFRRSELQQLEDMLVPFLGSHPHGTPAAAVNIDAQEDHAQSETGEPMAEESLMALAIPPGAGEEGDIAAMLPAVDDFSMDTWFSTAQMIDIANSIANSDTEWVSQNIIAHGI